MMQAVVAAADTSHVITAVAATAVGNHNYMVGGLIVAVGIEAVAILLLLYHKGWDAIANVPTTNLRTLISIALFSMFNVSVITVGYLTGTYPPEFVIVWMESFICVAMGLDVLQYTAKRFTTDANIPSIQNVAGGITRGPAQSPPAPSPTPIVPPAVVPVVPALDSGPIRDDAPSPAMPNPSPRVGHFDAGA